MLEVLIGLFGTAFLGAFGWAIQSHVDLEKRVVTIEAEYDGLSALINSRFDEVNRRLERIERAMNGTLGE